MKIKPALNWLNRYKRRIILSVLAIFISWIFLYVFFVLPSPFFKPVYPKLEKPISPRNKVFDLISQFPPATGHKFEKKNWAMIRPDYFQGGYQVSLGKYLHMVESRRAVPANRSYLFNYKPVSGSDLRFSLGVGEKPGYFEIKINQQKVFSQILFPQKEKKKNFISRFLSLFQFRFKPQKGYWQDHKIFLDRWSGRDIIIELKGDHGYWGDPIITEKSAIPIPKPNVIFIQIDALRHEVASSRAFTGIKKMLQKGSSFENAFSSSNWTRPSNMVQFFSKSNAELGLNTYDFYIHPLEREFFYKQKFLSLPLLFWKNGYQCAAIGDNIFIHGFSEWGIDIGFSMVKDFEKLKYESVYIVNEAINWINQKNGLPFFLYLDFNQAHSPYKPPIHMIDFKLIFKDYRYSFYNACIKYIDYCLNHFFQQLEDAGILDNTIIIINGDHGENFVNFGREYLDFRLKKSTVREHACTVWGEEIKTALIFYWPKRIPVSEISDPVSTLDIPKTIVSLAGLEYPSDWKGRDLSAILYHPHQKIQSEALIVEGRNEVALIDENHQYITGIDHRHSDQLYNLQADPYCFRNLIYDKPEKAISMREKLKNLYPQYYPVVFIQHSLETKQPVYFDFNPESKLKFSGGSSRFSEKGNGFVLQDKGFVYFVFERFPNRINFNYSPIWVSPLSFPYPLTTENLTVIDSSMFFSAFNPYYCQFLTKKGVHLSIIPVMSLVKDDRFNPDVDVSQEMKKILIDWGYVKE